MAQIVSTNLPLQHTSGVADSHLLTIAGASAIGIGVAGATTIAGAVAPIVLGVSAGSVAGFTAYRHWRRLDSLTEDQLLKREQLLQQAAEL